MAKAKDVPDDKTSMMKEYLDNEKKTTVLLPLIQGEYPIERVCINDNVYWVKRGEPVEVPESVANILMDKLRAEGKLSQISAQYVATGKTDPDSGANQ